MSSRTISLLLLIVDALRMISIITNKKCVVSVSLSSPTFLSAVPLLGSVVSDVHHYVYIGGLCSAENRAAVVGEGRVYESEIGE